jgi:uncharacterized protein YjcR
MSRERSPDRAKALKTWLNSGREMKPAEIAAKLGISAALVRKWKSMDKWEEHPEPKRGAPKGNRNAKGNRGGKGGPPGNDKAVTHGLFRKILPNDPETREIFDASADLSPLDILWTSIRIAWTNIMRSQKIMFVRDRDDMTRELKREKPSEWGTEEEWELQFAWDKQGRALSSQGAAMASLTRMIKQYEEMLRAIPPEEVREEQRMRIEKLKVEVATLKKDETPIDPVVIKDDLHE